MTLLEETPQQRGERYLRQATELARLAAQSSDAAISAAYLDMARVWVKLADELSRTHPANDDVSAAADRRDGEARSR